MFIATGQKQPELRSEERQGLEARSDRCAALPNGDKCFGGREL